MGVYIRVRRTAQGKPRYAVVYRRHGRYSPTEHAGTFGSRREAELRKRVVEDWLAQVMDPRVELARANAPGLTVEEAVRDWLKTKRRISDGTRVEYERRVELIVERFGDRPLEALSASDVSRWVGELEDAYAPSTVAQYVTTLRQALDSTGLPNVARDRRVELPRNPRRIVQPPDADVTLAVLARLTPRYRQVCVLMEQCGLRVGESCAVTPRDVDVTAARLLVPVTKTGAPRWVPLPRWLHELLNPPWPFTRQTVYHAITAACDLAGVERFGPHMLRHRRASLWHLQGVPPVQAGAWLGHSAAMHLATYAHVMPVSEIEAHRLARLLQHDVL